LGGSPDPSIGSILSALGVIPEGARSEVVAVSTCGALRAIKLAADVKLKLRLWYSNWEQQRADGTTCLQRPLWCVTWFGTRHRQLKVAPCPYVVLQCSTACMNTPSLLCSSHRLPPIAHTHILTHPLSCAQV